MGKFVKITPEMVLLQMSDGLRCDGVGAGAIKYYLARSEMTDSLMCSIIEKVAALEDQARMGSK